MPLALMVSTSGTPSSMVGLYYLKFTLKDVNGTEIIQPSSIRLSHQFCHKRMSPPLQHLLATRVMLY